MPEINNQNSDFIRSVPEPTLRRLPLYYEYLRRWAAEGKPDFVSCTPIASALNFLPIQVRKDLEIAGAQGRPKVGYSVSELIKAIEDFLGWDNTTDAFLVGAGNLGMALLGYQGFKDYGLNIIAAFDVDKNKIGKEVLGKKIFSIKKMAEMIKRMHIQIGILTAPAQQAQELSTVMIQAGIKAIWNFAPIRISVPENIIVQHENLASSLTVLSKRLAMDFKK